MNITQLPYYIVLSLGLVVSLVFCFHRASGYSIKNLMFKSVSSLCYLLTGVFALLINSSAYIYGCLIIFGGALGLVGDILLDLKGIYRKDEKAYLNGGFLFFLVGHIFYSSALVYSAKLKWWIVLICVVFSACFGLISVLAANILKVHYGAYRKIVGVYVAFLALTMSLAIACAIVSHFSKVYVVMAIGSILFLLSDAILSNTFFGRNKDTKGWLFFNHLFYYAGQYLIAASVLFM